jgi:hypothetical protein
LKAIIISKKTGFKNLIPSRPLIIRDFRGKLFYSTVGLKIIDKFNLPEGSYNIEQGDIEPLSEPVKFTIKPLPKPQRFFKLPNDFQIIFEANPNKCTIKWLEKKIIFDTDLLQKTIPELFFILYHEYGHSLYTTEKYADAFAANLMLKKGYNPSQIGSAPITALSSLQFERKKYIVKRML